MAQRNIMLTIAFAVVHLALYLGFWAVAFTTGDSGQPVPASLGLPVAALGTPLMYLLYLPPSTFGPDWWGDDMNFILLLAGANALLWGAGVTALVRAWERHRTIKI